MWEVSALTCGFPPMYRRVASRLLIVQVMRVRRVAIDERDALELAVLKARRKEQRELPWLNNQHSGAQDFSVSSPASIHGNVRFALVRNRRIMLTVESCP